MHPLIPRHPATLGVLQSPRSPNPPAPPIIHSFSRSNAARSRPLSKTSRSSSRSARQHLPGHIGPTQLLQQRPSRILGVAEFVQMAAYHELLEF